jgi:hypothetical protein
MREEEVTVLSTLSTGALNVVLRGGKLIEAHVQAHLGVVGAKVVLQIGVLVVGLHIDGGAQVGHIIVGDRTFDGGSKGKRGYKAGGDEHGELEKQAQ